MNKEVKRYFTQKEIDYYQLTVCDKPLMSTCASCQRTDYVRYLWCTLKQPTYSNGNLALAYQDLVTIITEDIL